MPVNAVAYLPTITLPLHAHSQPSVLLSECRRRTIDLCDLDCFMPSQSFVVYHLHYHNVAQMGLALQCLFRRWRPLQQSITIMQRSSGLLPPRVTQRWEVLFTKDWRQYCRDFTIARTCSHLWRRLLEGCWLFSRSSMYAVSKSGSWIVNKFLLVD